MINITRLGLGTAAATVAFGLFIAGAQAQTPAAPATTAPGKAPVAKTVPGVKAETPAKAPAKTEAPVTAAKKGSTCKGLVEGACGTNADCQWIVSTKANKATGKVAAPYCKTKPKAKGSTAAGSGSGASAAMPAPAKGSAAPPPAPAKK